MIGRQVEFIRESCFPKCSKRRSGGLLSFLFKKIAQQLFGVVDHISAKALPKNLALNFNPPKICACANVLHQIWNFWK